GSHRRAFHRNLDNQLAITCITPKAARCGGPPDQAAAIGCEPLIAERLHPDGEKVAVKDLSESLEQRFPKIDCVAGGADDPCRIVESIIRLERCDGLRRLLNPIEAGDSPGRTCTKSSSYLEKQLAVQSQPAQAMIPFVQDQPITFPVFVCVYETDVAHFLESGFAGGFPLIQRTSFQIQQDNPIVP